MAPARSSSRRASKPSKPARQRPSRSTQNGRQPISEQPQQIQLRLGDPASEPDPPGDSEHEAIFIDPVFGTPLAIYVEKDVDDRDTIVETISKYGGTVSQAYSGVTYVLVDPYKESGQSLYRQYASKKNKIVLNAQWVLKCVAVGSLQGFNVNWAGCKVTGKEPVGNPPPPEGQASVQPSATAPASDAVVTANGTAMNAPMTGASNEMPVNVAVRGDVATRAPPVHTGLNPATFYPPGVPSGLDPSSVYRSPPIAPPNAHHEYATIHYAMHAPPVQDPAAHQLPPTHDPAAQQVAPTPLYASPVPQSVVDAAATTSPPTQRSSRARRSKRNQDTGVPPLPPTQTVNGHPMPVTASSIDPLDPLAHAFATQRQEEERQRQEEERTRQEEEERRRRQEDDDRIRRQEEEHRRRDQGPQQGPAYNYPGYQPMNTEHATMPEAPPQSWHAPGGIAPQQTHIAAPPMYAAPHDYSLWPPTYRPPEGMVQPQAQPSATPQSQTPAQAPPPAQPQSQPEYDYRYSRDVRPPWVEGAGYYPPQQQPYGSYFQPPQPPHETHVPEAGPSQTSPSQPLGHATGAQPRGRKRQRAQPAPPAASLVANRHNPPARSPTPPSRVVKSTYGGNLFTSDDIMYLKKYIDYVQEQGLVLSLREICERIAVKAPHHTFYSWRRYCNKHQIRLGGYHMDIDEEFPNHHEDDGPEPEQSEQRMQVEQSDPPPAQATTSGVTPGIIAQAQRIARSDVHRARSPTPPRALFRSTTGKGVAFTEEDVTFLVRFLEYRNRIQDGKVDMVLFWKEVFAKAPHHSRASWMKFYRRHKHELEHTEDDAPLPAKPEKKMRYSKADDGLLARYFVNKPEGTSDKIFQEFARMHPHHPWKGWQEHHRIHKAKIDHLISKLQNGESIDEEATDE